jgi:predicted nucleotidyltransferase
MEATAFLTGSHAYGTPHDKSDVDIVVRMEQSEMDKVTNLVRNLAHPFEEDGVHVFEQEEMSESQTCEHSVSVRLGKFNLIACSTDDSFELWKDGTRILKEARPVTRDHAIAVFDRLRKERGL